MEKRTVEILTNDSCHCCRSWIPKVKDYAPILGYEVLITDINSHPEAVRDLEEEMSGLPFTICRVNGEITGFIKGDVVERYALQRLRETLMIDDR